MQISIQFGAMVPKLKEQLKGYEIAAKDLDLLQRDADALVRLHVRGLITDSIANSARNKLMKKIMSAVKCPKGEKGGNL